MPKFISKVQHDTYEKGEFSDEKERTLEETIELVKSFPFDAERNFTDIQLTGPSVTIQDEYLNYLKVGLYFNGKLCVYYLDNDNHLYKCYVLSVDDACNLATDFFNGTLDLTKFEKHLFNIGSRKHFENGNFDYTINQSRFYMRFIFTLLFCLPFPFFGVCLTYVNAPILVKLFLIPICFIITCQFIFALLLIIGYYLKSKNIFLHLSSGADSFKFGIGDEVKEYIKSDIIDITIYWCHQSRRIILFDTVFNVVEVKFNDNSIIEFPGFLIDQFLIQKKFPNNQITIIYKISELIMHKWKFAFSNKK